jgi:hypothetical protein
MDCLKKSQTNFEKYFSFSKQRNFKVSYFVADGVNLKGDLSSETFLTAVP